MTDLNALGRANAARWAKAKVTRNFTGIAKSLLASKSRYKNVEAQTGVPWYVIAVIHERESSQNWNSSLAQGDPWNRVSVHVPRGRGPFKSWEDAAVDALKNCHPYLARTKDWSLPNMLAKLEAYNGLGYAARGVVSPYMWAGTDQYVSGKYVADGKYDPGHVDNQPGCVGMLKALMALDPSIKIGAPVSKTAKVLIPVIAASSTAGAAHQAGLGWGWIVGIAAVVAVVAFIAWRFKK